MANNTRYGKQKQFQCVTQEVCRNVDNGIHHMWLYADIMHPVHALTQMTLWTDSAIENLGKCQEPMPSQGWVQVTMQTSWRLLYVHYNEGDWTLTWQLSNPIRLPQNMALGYFQKWKGLFAIFSVWQWMARSKSQSEMLKFQYWSTVMAWEYIQSSCGVSRTLGDRNEKQTQLRRSEKLVTVLRGDFRDTRAPENVILILSHLFFSPHYNESSWDCEH